VRRAGHVLCDAAPIVTKTAALLVAAVASACAADRAMFQPTENVTTTGHGGQPAAAYDLRGSPEQDPRVHIRVWSQGARSVEGRTHVYLTVEVQNTSEENVTVDTASMRLDGYDNAGRPLPASQAPAAIAGYYKPLMVAPGAAGTVNLYFELARGIGLEDIQSLRLRWALEHDDGERYVQFTEFQRARPPEYTSFNAVYYDPVFGLYDPLFYGPRFGYRVHYHVPVRRVLIDRRPHPVRR
jgi:hypothetical protein